ncbi:hypothetical protein GCM10029978_067080 [Actinoallomurus acanthiterrae]
MDDPIIVDPDMPASMRAHRKAQLSELVDVQAWVQVRNPLTGDVWEGVIIGLADHPVMLLRDATDATRCLPQYLAVEQIDPPLAPPGRNPVEMSREELLAVLDQIRAGVAAGDSLEGGIEYLMPAPGSAAEFAVRGGYRVGNTHGQGGYVHIARGDASDAAT